MKVGIIGGTGDQGLGLALRLARAGEEIIIGSRDVKKAENAVSLVKNMLNDDEVHKIKGTTNQDAAREAELPCSPYPCRPRSLP